MGRSRPVGPRRGHMPFQRAQERPVCLEGVHVRTGLEDQTDPSGEPQCGHDGGLDRSRRQAACRVVLPERGESVDAISGVTPEEALPGQERADGASGGAAQRADLAPGIGQQLGEDTGGEGRVAPAALARQDDPSLLPRPGRRVGRGHLGTGSRDRLCARPSAVDEVSDRPAAVDVTSTHGPAGRGRCRRPRSASGRHGRPPVLPRRPGGQVGRALSYR